MFVGFAGRASGSKVWRMSVQVQQYLFEFTARNSFSQPNADLAKACRPFD
jgi:hypothetical protein